MIKAQEQTKKISRKKYTFTLKDIDSAAIDKKYGFQVETPLLQEDEIIPQNATLIDDLTTSIKQDFFSPFLEQNCVTMIDSITKKSIQTSCCFWCRNSFSSLPIGCPINYVGDKVCKFYTSEITKEKYTVTQNITKKMCREYTANPQKDIKIAKNEYYETDGSFCSFNCCLAFIHDNTHKAVYKNSKNLLMKMYVEIFKKKKLAKISPAPSWRLLKEYGGFMTIEEFRASFSNYIYIDSNYFISELPRIMPIGHVFEKQIVF